MQRFLFLKSAASPFSQKLSNSSLAQLSQHHRIFTTTTKPCLPNSLAKYSLLSRPPPSSSHHSSNLLSRRVHGFFSHPLLPKHFTSSTFRISTKEYAARKFRLFGARFSRGFSGSNSSFANNGRFGRSWLDQLSTDNVVLGLIIANFAVFTAWTILDQKFMSRNFMISLDNVKSGRIHTMITSAFSHIGAYHIISNMIGLYFFGTTGNGMHAKDPSKTAALGASGAVNAIVLLRILLNPRATIYLDFIYPVPAALLGIYFIAKDVLYMLQKDSKISGSAHLGGAAVAAVAYARIRKGRF